MNVIVSGQQISVGSSLQTHATERVEQVVLKYFSHAISANVTFSKQGYLYLCDISVNEGTGRKAFIKSSDSSDDAYAAFDSALVKLEKQLRRYKSRLNNKGSRIRTTEALEVIAATKYVISPNLADDMDENSGEDNPVIVAEKPAEIMTLSVSDAVMKMDLESLPALMFKNIKNGRINVVYYRKDGNISWLDTKE